MKIRVKSGLSVRKEIECEKGVDVPRCLTDTGKKCTEQTTLSTTICHVVHWSCDNAHIFTPIHEAHRQQIDNGGLDGSSLDANMPFLISRPSVSLSFSFSYIPVSVREEDYA